MKCRPQLSMRRCVFLFLCLLGSICAYGQSCDCPAAGTCFSCAGGISSFTLRYNGSTTQTITAADQQGTVFTQVVAPNGTFTFQGSQPNQKFVGSSVDMSVGGVANATIPSNCGAIFVGNVYGSFSVVAANSMTGGALCCSVAATETTAPTITGCPSNRTVSLPAGACQVGGGWTAPTASDNCTLASFTSTKNPTDLLGIGLTTVTYTAVDSYNNTSTCSFTVTVIDDKKPVISNCPTDITIEATSSCQAIASWTAPTVSDNCSATLSVDRASGTIFPFGTTVVTYTATDPSNNMITCSFNVKVVDTTKPVISNCPTDITIETTSSCQAIVSWTAPTVSDNCSATLSVDHASGTIFPFGTTVVTYTATDPSNNMITCSFNVKVVDTTAPVISNCPTDITIEATSSCQAIVSWTAPTATDNCSATLSVDHGPGTSFPFGTTLVTYKATDPSNNTITCSFNVNVKDTTAPVISNCPTDITIEATSSCLAMVSWTPPTTTDNCSATISGDHSLGTSFPFGKTLVTYTATDPTGNKSTCTFNVNVKDTTSPVIGGCPSDIVMSIAECESTVTWGAPTVTDNCHASIQSSHQPASVFPLGTTVVTYTATDDAGNKTTCTFNVTLKNTQAPVISGCPDNITVHAYDESVSVTWTAPQATPLCGNLLTQLNYQPGESFNVGVTEVTYEFEDGTKNKTQCSFNVTVVRDLISFEVSKAVTPNGDGINDTWSLTNIEKYNDNTVTVVDRWGNKIYQVSGYDNSNVLWTGIGPSGSKVPVGTYFYTIEVRIGDQLVRDSGFIEVIY